MTRIVFPVLTLLSLTSLTRADETQPTETQLQFVQTKVIPVLTARCYECHGDSGEVRGSLRLTSRKAMLRGGDSGASIVPGKPDESLLIEAVRYESFEMPPRTRLPDEEIAILSKWIADGAHWPEHLDAEPLPEATEFPLEERRRSHWAWQPVQAPSPPQVSADEWPADDIDAFVLSRLEAAGLRPAADADRYTLIRRLYFDIIGLPPSIAQIEAFVNSPLSDTEAIKAVADELLASPHLGERWGRHWLDLVRYAETLGHEFDYPLHHASQYRDYVIRALNADVPYDQWIREHIAGDLLPTPRKHVTEGYNESVIGTGFWFLNEDKHAPVDVKGEEAAKIDNRIDVFSKTFLGLTVACARCHDHKFDAITTEDYYALSGFLQSSRRQTTWLDPGRKIHRHTSKLTAARADVRAALATHLKKQQSPESIQDSERYARAALMAVSSGLNTEDPESSKKETQQIADAQSCDASLLQNWVAALKDDRNRSLDSVLSLLPELAAADSADSKESADAERNRAQRWGKRVLNSASDDETILFADFTSGLPNDWFASGHAFASSSRSSDQPFKLSCDQRGIQVAEAGGLSSAALSHELRGTLAGPEFKLEHPEILVQVAGAGCRVRLVIDGYVMYEHNKLLFNGAVHKIDTEGQYRWIRLAADVHRYQGHRMHLEFLDEGSGWFAVRQVRFARRRGARPPNEVSPFNRRLAAQLMAADDSADAPIRVWAEQLHADPAALAASIVNDRATTATLPETVDTAFKAWQQGAKQTPQPFAVIAMTDGTPEDEAIFIRGNHKNPGRVAPRRFLTALRGNDTVPEFEGSGRLDLAARLLDADNPLTARVVVNRIWHHLLGRGIVPSTDNFGVLGQLPTHPLLLDHLATRFRGDDWSVKSLIRHIVLSRTYRMDSTAAPEAIERDPNNDLLHSHRVRRLEGEALRDAILTVSGRLDRSMFGRPVPIYLTPFMQGRGRPGKSGPLDGNGRRSIYIAVRRNFLSPLMLAFDVPAPVSTTGRRTSSNVPAQALIMLNNEFINQQAGLWASRLQSESAASCHELLSKAWYELLGHPPTEQDIAPLMEFAGVKPDAPTESVSTETLTDVCHVLMNAKEFAFVR